MISLYVAKLTARFNLTTADQHALSKLPMFGATYKPRDVIHVEDRTTNVVGVICFGFASTFKKVGHNKRQITGFLLPGDAIDLSLILINKPSAHVVANIDTDVAWLAKDPLRTLCFERPNIATALWLDTLIDAGIRHEWMANIGQRSAPHRLLHLMLELYTRHKWLGSLDGNSFALPFNQKELSDALGMSLVHTNKSLRMLADQKLLHWKSQRVEIPDYEAARTRIRFNPTYLWLDKERPPTERLLGAEPPLGEPLPNEHERKS